MKKILLAAMLALLGASPALAAAQAAGVDDAAAPDEQAASGYSDGELRSFAVAALEIQHIRDAYGPKILAAGDTSERQRLMLQAGEEMTSAVERQGMSVDKFGEILAAAQGDDTLVERINERLNEPRQSD
jgi:hypothetical protein